MSPPSLFVTMQRTRNGLSMFQLPDRVPRPQSVRFTDGGAPQPVSPFRENASLTGVVNQFDSCPSGVGATGSQPQKAPRVAVQHFRGGSVK
jgi:hypothetical protein